MTTIVFYPVTIQTSAQFVPSTPPWFGEVTIIAHYLRLQGVFPLIEERVRFARRRFGHYDLIDFVMVLLGYAISLVAPTSCAAHPGNRLWLERNRYCRLQHGAR